MNFDQLLALIAQLQDAVNQLKSQQNQFSQADLDAAVKAAIDPLSAQIAGLQAQVQALPGSIHDAVVAEDARIAGVVKSLLDQAVAAIAPIS